MSFIYPASAEVEKAEHRGDIEHIHERTEDAEHKDLLSLGKTESVILLVELGFLSLLTVEDLDYLHAGQVFGEEGVDVCRRVLDLSVGAAGEFSEYDGEEHDERHKAHDHERQLIVQAEHRREHAYYHEAVLDEVDEDVREHHRDGVGIVRYAGYELSDRGRAELRVGQALDVREEILTQFRDYPLTGLLEDYRLNIRVYERYNEVFPRTR